MNLSGARKFVSSWLRIKKQFYLRFYGIFPENLTRSFLGRNKAARCHGILVPPHNLLFGTVKFSTGILLGL